MSDPAPLEPTPSKRPAMRVQKSLAFVQRVRLVLYALLVASALLSFWAGGPQSQGMPAWTPIVAPVLFGAFLLVFAVYRLSLIRARHYPASTGLFQIGLGALVFVLLLPGPRRAISGRGLGVKSQHDDILAAIDSPVPGIRAIATELAGYRPASQPYATALVQRLDDPDQRVRALARASLSHLMGLPPADDSSEEAATARIRAELASRGWPEHAK